MQSSAPGTRCFPQRGYPNWLILVRPFNVVHSLGLGVRVHTRSPFRKHFGYAAFIQHVASSAYDQNSFSVTWPGDHVRAVFQSMHGGPEFSSLLYIAISKIEHLPCSLAAVGQSNHLEDLIQDDEHAMEILEDYFAGVSWLYHWPWLTAYIHTCMTMC